jgi:hypothetical protein
MLLTHFLNIIPSIFATESGDHRQYGISASPTISSFLDEVPLIIVIIIIKRIERIYFPAYNGGIPPVSPTCNTWSLPFRPVWLSPDQERNPRPAHLECAIEGVLKHIGSPRVSVIFHLGGLSTHWREITY